MNTTETKGGNAISATLLVAGCCIGSGMLGLPVKSALPGFIPSTCVLLLAYFFATATGLLLLEATLWFDHKVNLLSLANFALGKAGKGITWFLFLFLFYCIFVAQMDGGGQLFTLLLSTMFHCAIPREIGIICSALFVGSIAYKGTKAVSLTSRLFLVGLILSYCGLLSLGLPHVQGERLLHGSWTLARSTIPIALVCFGYQNLIPTLTYYVKKNVRAMRMAIFVGTLIPFIIYSLWNFVILGILPEANSTALAEIVRQSNMVTGLLERASESKSVLFFANIFSFFALFTPCILNSVAFVDFLKDGLKVNNVQHDLALYGLVLVPPTLLTMAYPHLFLKALSLAGGIVDVILFGILPVLIVWVGRYVKKAQGPCTAPGGKLFLLSIFLLSVFFLSIR